MVSSKAPSLFLGGIWMKSLCGGLISFCKNPSYKQISKLLWQRVSLSWECLPPSSTGQDLAKPIILKHNQWVETSRNPMLPRKVPARQAGSWEMTVEKVVGERGGSDDILSWLSLQEVSLEARQQQAKELKTSGFAEVLARRVWQMDLCRQNRSLRCQARTVQTKMCGLSFIYFRLLWQFFSFHKIIKVLE